jgi:hypothetical protein
MKRIKVVEKPKIYEFGSVHFWQLIHPKKLRNLQKKRSKVSTGSKVRGFDGTVDTVSQAYIALHKTLYQVQNF